MDGTENEKANDAARSDGGILRPDVDKMQRVRRGIGTNSHGKLTFQIHFTVSDGQDQRINQYYFQKIFDQFLK